MTIGINATAALKQPRTGVEQYTYQLIKHLTMLPEARKHRFLLYVRPGSTFDFSLPDNFIVKELKWSLPIFWTQVRLAWEMWRRPPEILFIPVHILPLFAPKNSVVTIHGLEYEYFPKHYPWLHRWYLRWSTRRAVKHAAKIIAISECTKQDLVKFYEAAAKKIEVVYHGIDIEKHKFQNPNYKQNTNSKIQKDKPYILYLGRVETKKNIQGLLDAYKILKEEYGVPHQLVLAGVPGYGYQEIKLKIENCKLEIKELGYVTEEEKRYLLSNADVFLFPSFYEGFGLPVLEAQAAGVPAVISLTSCLPEVAGEGALYVNPQNSAQIAEAVKKVIDDSVLRDRLRQLGLENTRRFSWELCAKKTLEALKDACESL